LLSTFSFQLMKILWFTWKDSNHPAAGGAEFVNEQLAKRLAADGHEVIFLVGGFRGGEEKAERDGYQIIRLGNRWTVYLQAWRYFRKNLKAWPDLVIDEVNTMPFFAGLYSGKPTLLFIHQLCREIWFYQLPQPLSLLGYLLEPFYLRLLNRFPVITVSESTRQDLVRLGFDPTNVTIISEGIALTPVDATQLTPKRAPPSLLILGSIRPMKRTMEGVKAFELAKELLPELQLTVAGDDSTAYGARVRQYIRHSRHREATTMLGRVTTEQKIRLLQQAHLLLVTSVKEGWGLVVTEAASQGTPSVVYPVDGLRDSVANGEAGFLTRESTPDALAESIVQALTNPDAYRKMQTAAWEKSKRTTFDQAIEQLRLLFFKTKNSNHS